jgi:hypothetical protein
MLGQILASLALRSLEVSPAVSTRLENMSELNLPFTLAECQAIGSEISAQITQELGREADFSVDSLALCDLFIDALRNGTQKLDGRMYGQLIELGVYVGEVFRKQADGKWVPTRETALHGMTQMPYVISLRNGGAVNVLEKPVKRFTNGSDDSCKALFDMMTTLRPRPWWRFWR